ncbi:MAG: signal peptidase II [Buchnera aphidicola (Nurudea yanoniella)]
MSDIVSKNWIINNYSLFEIKSINSILNFFRIHNYGLAFSIFSNISKENKCFLFLINILTIIIILKIIYSMIHSHIYYNIPYVLIISGAIGNLISRLYFGFVIDFIDIHFKNWHSATFNIADISICIGCIFLLYIYFFEKNK